jgi:hypothetical protein
MKKLLLASVALLALAACSAPGTSETVTTNPIANVASVLDPAGAIKLDLTTTATNFDNAVAIGLPLEDDALCVHLINQELGIEASPSGTPPLPTATLTNNGPISAGSEILINAMILAQLKSTGLSVPANCVTAVGELRLMAASQLLTQFGGLPINVIPAASTAQLKKMVHAAK